jgi:hypothetical protein
VGKIKEVVAIGADPMQQNNQIRRLAAGKRRELRPVELHGRLS